MSDRLREAIEYWETERFTVDAALIDNDVQIRNSNEIWNAVDSTVAAARRFLALTETGPDYEAAKIKLHEILREAGVSVFVNADLVVDAALADYLTEDHDPPPSH